MNVQIVSAINLGNWRTIINNAFFASFSARRSVLIRIFLANYGPGERKRGKKRLVEKKSNLAKTVNIYYYVCENRILTLPFLCDNFRLKL